MANDSLGSSPDPLGLSINQQQLQATDARRATTPSSPRKPFGEDKGNIRLQDFYLETPQAKLTRSASPTKSVAQSENLISPWRIRVTVEAERNEFEDEHMIRSRSPAKRLTERTLTTTVPLKDADNSPTPHKRGRPPKSSENLKKRKGTPKPSRRKTQGDDLERLQSSDQAGFTPMRRPRGRPRKSLGSETEHRIIQGQGSKKGDVGYDSETITVWTPEKIRKRYRNLEIGDGDQNSGESNFLAPGHESKPSETPIPKKRKRRNAMTPARLIRVEDVEDVEDAESVLDKSEEPQKQQPVTGRGAAQPQLSPPPSSPRQILENNLGLGEGHQNKIPDRGDHDETFAEPHQAPSASYGSSEVDSIAVLDPEGEVNSNKRPGEVPGPVHDPTAHHREFDSILESEEFSMVSVSTLPSAKQNFGISPEMESRMADIARTLGQQTTEAEQKGTTEVSYPQLPSLLLLENQTDLTLEASRAPSSGKQSASTQFHAPLNHKDEIELPAQELTASIAPPPSRLISVQRPVLSSHKLTERSPSPAGVAGEGVALQDVLGSKTGSVPTSKVGFPLKANSSSTSRHLGEGQDHLFSGFGAGTRRELRAGLRLGEELAKRSQVAMKAAAAVQARSSPLIRNSTALQNTTPELLKFPTPQKATRNIDDESLNRSYELNTSEQQKSLDPTSTRKSSNHSQTQISSAVTHLPSPDDSKEDDEDRMSWIADIPSNMHTAMRNESQSPKQTSSNTKKQNEWRAIREKEWQMEREAVSKQIQDANSSKVIVIEDTTIAQNSVGHDKFDSSDLEADGDDIDIWQSEAYSGENSQNTQQATDQARRLLFPDATVKPRRGKLPSPWRRNSQVVYSDEVNPTSDDPFWPTEQITTNATGPSNNREAIEDEFSDLDAISESADFEPEDESHTPFQARPISKEASELGDTENDYEDDFTESVYSAQAQDPEVTENDEDGDDVEDLKDTEETEDAIYAEDSEDSDDEGNMVYPPQPAWNIQQRTGNRTNLPRMESEVPGVQSAIKSTSLGVARPVNRRLFSDSRASTNENFGHNGQPQPQAKSHLIRDLASAPADLQYPTLPDLSGPSKSAPKRSLPDAQSSEESLHASKRPRINTALNTTETASKVTSQNSWLARLSSFIPRPTLLDLRLWTVPSFLQPPGPKPHATEPLSIYLPWTNAHYRALRPIYLIAKRDPYAYPYSSSSSSAYLLDYVVKSQGWRKPIEKWELGVVDAFLDLLDREGSVDFTGGPEAAKKKELWEIDEEDVIKRVFSLWCGEVMRGEAELGPLGTAGVFDEKHKHREAEVKGW